MVSMGDPDGRASKWHERYASLGRAHSRYLWAILVLSGFFWAIQASLVQSCTIRGGPIDLIADLSGGFPDVAAESCAPPADQAPFVLPVIGLPVSPTVIWLAAPGVLSLLVLTLLGALAAASDVLQKLGDIETPGEARREVIDTEPNALDLAFHFHRSRPRKGVLEWLNAYKYYVIAWLVLGESALLWLHGVSHQVYGIDAQLDQIAISALGLALLSAGTVRTWTYMSMRIEARRDSRRESADLKTRLKSHLQTIDRDLAIPEDRWPDVVDAWWALRGGRGAKHCVPLDERSIAILLLDLEGRDRP